MRKSGNQKLGLARLTTIVAANAVGMLAIAAIGGRSWYQANQNARSPKLQNEPTVVLPQFDRAEVISDAQLFTVLDKLQPRLNHPRPKINFVDHALRFWGDAAAFSDSQMLSGIEMRNMILDHGRFQKSWGSESRPLVFATPSGSLAFRTQQGQSTISHVDHALGTLAEIGTPLTESVTLNNGQTTLGRLVVDAIERFSLNQPEYEWTTLLIALYAKDDAAWTTREGQRVDFNTIARRLMRQELAEGVCYGQHRIYTLAILLRVDQEKRLLSSETRSQILQHLTNATARLVATQDQSGYWDANWPELQLPVDDTRLKAVSRRISATGHSLEWWAMAPPELHPPRETLVRAGQWLVREIENFDQKQVTENYTFLSHVGRALCLWRGELPFDAWMRINESDDLSTGDSDNSKEPK